MYSEDPKAQRRRRSPDGYVFAALVAVSFATLLISTRSFIIDFRQFGLSLFSGARESVSAVSNFTGRTVGSIRELSSLRKQYAEVVARLQRYENLERDAAGIRSENLRLKEQLGFSDTIVYRHIPARISGRDPDNLYSALVINKGAKDGIVRNMPIIAFQNGVQGLVGKVVQVGRYESLVMPVYDENAFISCRLSESRYEGIAVGQDSPDEPLIVQYVKKRAKDEIHYGDVIVTSGLGGIYPSDIVIGRVAKINVQEYETSLELEVEGAIDFSRLEYVFAVSSEQPAEPAATIQEGGNQ